MTVTLFLCTLYYMGVPQASNSAAVYTALRPFVLRLFASKSLANLHHSLACAHFRFNVLWLAVLYEANHLYLNGIPFSIYTLFIGSHFSGNATKA